MNNLPYSIADILIGALLLLIVVALALVFVRYLRPLWRLLTFAYRVESRAMAVIALTAALLGSISGALFMIATLIIVMIWLPNCPFTEALLAAIAGANLVGVAGMVVILELWWRRLLAYAIAVRIEPAEPETKGDQEND